MVEANKHRRHLEFKVDDWVFWKFRPYRQKALFRQFNTKLAPRFFGPFQILERVGAVAYRLKLPDSTRVHPVFHVSLLKPAVGSHILAGSLPTELDSEGPPFLPERVLQGRVVVRNGASVEQVLVQCSGLGDDDATWLDVEEVQRQFPDLSLVVKAVSERPTFDRPDLQVYVRRAHG